MSIVKQLARLFCGHQQEIAFLNRKIVDLQKLIPIDEPKPEIELLSMSTNEVWKVIQPLKLKMIYPGLLDSQYYYTTAKDWAEVFDYIFFKFDMPSYLADRMDCDDFAILLKGLVDSFFGLNYFATVIGTMPAGGHSWNLFMTENGLLQFEPQTGNFFEIGEQGYKPEYILL